MLGLDTLDVAIGLVFVYLMVSFVCSAAAEVVELIWKERPRSLHDGIVELVGSDFVQKIYEHPLVAALYQNDYVTRARSLPSYIPSRNFALAVLGMIGAPTAGQATNLDDIKQSIDALAGNPKTAKIYNALNAIYLGAEGKAENVIKGVEDWYNSTMDRVSGWYKRYAQWWLLFFGIIIAVAMNVDTVNIVRYLAVNKTTRDAIVASASAAVQRGMPQPGQPATVKEAESQLVESIGNVNALGLPIGWGKNPVWDSSQVVPAVKAHGIGWLLTAVAVSFGAPFWFDVLNKFMVVRSTVKPKEKSGNEKSKDSK